MTINSSSNDKADCPVVDGWRKVQRRLESLTGQETPSALNRVRVLGTRPTEGSREDCEESSLIPTILHTMTFSSPQGTKHRGILEVPLK